MASTKGDTPEGGGLLFVYFLLLIKPDHLYFASRCALSKTPGCVSTLTA